MGCQGRRGSMACALCATLLCAFACASPAAANSIVVDDVVVGEAGSATFTITRHADFLSPATTVDFRTIAGSASAEDFAARAGTLTFGAAVLGGTRAQQVTVSIADDQLDEHAESFALALSGAEAGAGPGTATIVDNDPEPALAAGDSPAAQEGSPGAKASFGVHLSSPSGRAVSVSYATANGSAVAGQDYVKTEGTLVLAAGTQDATIKVDVLDDGADEPAESFQLKLGAPDGAGGGAKVLTGTIVDDDEPPAPPTAPASPASGTSPGGQGGPGPATGSSGSAPAQPALGLSSPRLKRPSTVLMTISCPREAGRCSGRITLFSVANRRSRIKALRRERRLGRVKFSVAGAHAQTVALSLGRTDLGLLKRTGRMRVRAYALTEDASGRAGVRIVGGTLIARTAHSSSSSG